MAATFIPSVLQLARIFVSVFHKVSRQTSRLFSSYALGSLLRINTCDVDWK